MTLQKTLEDFDTQLLLDAVDELDNLRGILADGPNLEPPQLRTDLLNLHKLAMNVCRHGSDEASSLMDEALDIEDQMDILSDGIERIQRVLQNITAGIYENE